MINTFAALSKTHPSLSALTEDLNCSLSRTGLHLRYTETAAFFIKKCLEYIISVINPNCIDIKNKFLSQFSRFIIADSTSFDVSKKLKKTFKGSGGAASDANCKIQLLYDFKKSSIELTELQAGVSSDARYSIKICEHLNKNDLIVQDLGYFNSKYFKQVNDKKAFFISRLKSTVNLYEFQNNNYNKIDIIKYLKNYKDKNQFEFFAFIGDTETRMKMRVLFTKLPKSVVRERRKEHIADSRKKGHTPSKLSLALCEWNILITNIPETMLSQEIIYILYSIRWTIELIFKQLKSILKIHKSNHDNGDRLQCEIYGKLIVACFICFIYGTANSCIINNYGQELSFDKVYKFFKNHASELFSNIKLGTKHIYKFIRLFFKKFLFRCLKFYQNSRKSSLQKLL